MATVHAPSRRTLGPRLAVVWFSLSAAALVWPLYPWLGNHVHPRVLGLPWSLVYVLLVIAANFGVLLVLYARRVVDDREPTVGEGAAPTPAPTEDREGPPP